MNEYHAQAHIDIHTFRKESGHNFDRKRNEYNKNRIVDIFDNHISGKTFYPLFLSFICIFDPLYLLSSIILFCLCVCHTDKLQKIWIETEKYIYKCHDKFILCYFLCPFKKKKEEEKSLET